MDFKIKFKAGYLFVIVAVAFLIFLGGVMTTASFDSTSNKGMDIVRFLVGIGISIGATVILLMTVHAPNRSNSKIDIDSFTEAAINDAIEDKWNEVKKQVMKG